MNRFDRITAILIQLQSKKVVKAQDLADRFDISLRTVYRDIRSLEEAGVPLYGEAGVGYSLVDGYRLPPVMFTPDEAMAFVTAEKLMAKFTDRALQENFTSAMYKVKAVLRGSEKEMVENLDSQIVVKGKNEKNPLGNVLDVLLKAIAEKKVVKMTYRSFGNEESTERLVEPIGIFHENENWYTIAYCHLREEYRQFRIDRAIAAYLTAQAQEARNTLAEYQEYKDKIAASENLQKAVIRVDRKYAAYMQERRHFYGFVSEIEYDDYIDMTFLSQWLHEGLGRWYLAFADCAEILEPQSLIEFVTAYIQRVQNKMANHPKVNF